MTTDPALLLAIGVTLAFAFTNGFNDAANAIATLVATRIARPLPAVLMAAVFNLIGPLVLGAAVADAIGSIVNVEATETVAVLGAGLTSAVVWNTYTRQRGIPSSSSHALVGGLVGAALLDAGVAAVDWGPFTHGRLSGVFGVLLGMLVAAVAGFAVALVLERLALRALRNGSTRFQRPVRSVQWMTSAWLAFTHGSNDAQKAAGIVGALLFATGKTATFGAPLPFVLACSIAMTLGTTLGGWTIVRTIGRRIFPLRSLDGLVSQSGSASVILVASVVGAPVSTSQVVSSSIVGIGVGRRRWRHVGWEIVSDIALTWLTTIPATALLGAILLPVWKLVP
jgi:PiT family inorganic phosphate transporter